MNTINKSFNPTSTRDVRYLNRDFSSLKNALIAYSKNYFPASYKDFTPGAPGMMFIEQAAYVGDVLSFYTDYIFKENILETAQERKNIIKLAKYLGYKTMSTKAAVGTIDIYQLCPAATSGTGTYFPDPLYMLYLQQNSQFSNNSNLYYVLTQDVDFSLNSSNSPRVDTVYSRNTDGTPQFFLLQKTGNVMSGQIYTKQVNITAPVPNYTISLEEPNVLGILDVYDSDNNEWYEVNYMAQELIPIETSNSVTTQFSDYRDATPYILNYISTSKKFVVSVDENNLTNLTFGNGTAGTSDELLTLDSNLIGVGLSNIASVNIPVNTYTFLNNDNYGAAPFNTTLTIRYLVGGGINSNCQVGEINKIVGITYESQSEGLTPPQQILLNTVKNSIRVNNSVPCIGGADADTNDEIRMKAIASFSAQNRAVTADDYLTRIYSLPAQFGSISKAHVTSNVNINNKITIQSGIISGSNVFLPSDGNRQFITTNTNPFAINVYVLSYDSNKNLTTTNPATLFNLMTYLKQFKVLTDEINVIDGYIINIGIDISISMYKGYNKQDVISNCLTAAQAFFNIDNWTFSQPINIGQLQLQLSNITGVQSVSSINIYNKTIKNGLYSAVEYDISAATRDNIIYPSIDPSIFECKYPNSDISITLV